MRLRLGSGVPVLLLSTSLLAGCGLGHESDGRPEGATSDSIAQSTETVAASGSDLRVEGAVSPQLFGTTTGLVLLADRITDDGTGGAVLTATRADGKWTPVEVLSSDGVTTTPPFVALNREGAGVALWTETTEEQADAENPVSPPFVTRTRQEDGSWLPAEELEGITYIDDVQVNDKGDVAVLGYPDEGGRVLALRPAGGSWDVEVLPATISGSTLALDDEGGVHLASTEMNRGGGGPVSVSYRPRGGTWTEPQEIPIDNVSTDAARILALPGGGEALLVGAVSPNWQSTSDTQIYNSTEYHLLTRSDPSGTFKDVWTRDGATNLQAAVEGDGVRLTWAQNEKGVVTEGAEEPGPVPSQQALLTRGPDGTEERLGETPVEVASGIFGGITFETAPGCETPSVAWRLRDADDKWSDLHVSSGGRTTTVTDEGDRPDFDIQASLACVDGKPWLARTLDLEQSGSSDDGTLVLSNGVIGVDPAS